MELITKSILISLAIVGLRIISSKGMILYFLRMPYEWLRDKAERTIINKVLWYLLIPTIGCVVCMSSVYTIVINYYYFTVDKWILINIFVVCCLNAIIYGFYTKLND